MQPGEDNRTIDAGLRIIPPAYIPFFGGLGDYVWLDANGDGIQDADEQGVDGVTVHLYNRHDALVSTTRTASDADGKPGYYLFEELTPGTYTVKFLTPDGYRSTVRGAGRDPKRDSDAGEGGATGAITLAEGERNLTVDAGYVRIARAQLGDYVWYDKDANGTQNAGERGINGVRVELYDAQGQLLDTVVTADDAAGNRGYYLFDDLLPGEYTVKFVRPGGMKFTTRLAGDDRTVDSNADGSGFSEPVNLGEGERNRTIDVGLLIDPHAPEPLEIPLEELEGPLTPGGIPTIPEDPEEPSTPVTPPVPGEETPVSPPSTPASPVVSNPLQGQLPKTGESAPVLPWVGSAMMLLAIALWVRERRERRQRRL
ncbi:hypothetical protein PA598K_05222 [Paenibacillus sp. 598K]|uniref:SdrD B-like domain-containing protein n=1 Tax=Paenibacillus sp. 598K TaxID=1117987 RepID=UPI000FFA010D|nr:SdrD B-like domain-containing protein [Paenibacillus sp. 598K]GBF76736.1 hypothetical protein PA598K_05222 [Paenibacillus sp. 598K]